MRQGIDETQSMPCFLELLELKVYNNRGKKEVFLNIKMGA